MIDYPLFNCNVVSEQLSKVLVGDSEGQGEGDWARVLIKIFKNDSIY